MSKDEGRDGLLRVLSNGGAASGEAGAAVGAAAGAAAGAAGDGAAGDAADAGLLDDESPLVDRSDEVWALDATTRAPVASYLIAPAEPLARQPSARFRRAAYAEYGTDEWWRKMRTLPSSQRV